MLYLKIVTTHLLSLSQLHNYHPFPALPQYPSQTGEPSRSQKQHRRTQEMRNITILISTAMPTYPGRLFQICGCREVALDGSFPLHKVHLPIQPYLHTALPTPPHRRETCSKQWHAALTKGFKDRRCSCTAESVSNYY